jgi:hypothetical protein
MTYLDLLAQSLWGMRKTVATFVITYFRLSHWLIIDVNSLRLLHRVVVDNVTGVSEVHVASIFRVNMYMFVISVYI